MMLYLVVVCSYLLACSSLRSLVINRQAMSPSCLRALKGTTDISVTFEKILGSSIEKISAACEIKPHPGFAFGLGCDAWESSGFAGGVEGWSGEPKVGWYE